MKKILIGTLLVAAILLVIQNAFGFGSPDVAFHMSKILWAQTGDYFLDPFSGSQSVYPSFFHFLLGTLNSFLHIDPYYFAKMIGVVSFLGMFEGCFILARTILKNTTSATLATIFLGITTYAPSNRYVLLAEPFNFSVFFLLVGLSLVYKYAEGNAKKIKYLITGTLLLGFAVNLWWYHAILVGTFLIYVLVHLAKSKTLRIRHIIIGVICFLIPTTFTAFQFYSIREVLPHYQQNKDILVQSFGLNTVWEWFATLVTRGNLQFKSSVFPYATVTLVSLVQSVKYYLIFIPFGLFLLVSSCYRYAHDKIHYGKEKLLKRLLVPTAFITIFISMFTILIGHDIPRLRRIHFTALILLLIYCVSFFKDGKKQKIFNSILVLASVFSIITTSIHTQSLITHFTIPGNPVTESTREVIAFIKDKDIPFEKRIFLYQESLRELSPFVKFKSFISNTDDKQYLLQDYSSVKPILDAYLKLAALDPQWKEILKEFDVQYIILKYSKDDQEKAAVDFYRKSGRVVLQNHDWIIIEPQV